MFKVMVLIKRRSGMSMDEFKAYYEGNHVPLALEHVPHLQGYVRNYFTPMGGTHTEGGDELPFDVCTELHYANEEDFGKSMAALQQPEVLDLIVADEEKVFDRSTITFMNVDVRESELANA